MELKINSVTIPEQITFNYEELKESLLEKVKIYEAMVYGEDQIKEAKKDRASLNSLKKALNDERLRREKEYMQPFNLFKAQINEIIQIIDKPCAVIDKQIKVFEEKQKQEKLEAIRLLVAEVGFPVSLESVMDQKWLNSSVSLKSIREFLETKKEQILSEMQIVDDLPEFSFEAKHFYISSLDLAATMREVARLKEQAAEKAKWESEQKSHEKPQEATQEKIYAEPVNNTTEAENEPERQWIGFQALLSVDEAKALGNFLRSNGIKYKAI